MRWSGRIFTLPANECSARITLRNHCTLCPAPNRFPSYYIISLSLPVSQRSINTNHQPPTTYSVLFPLPQDRMRLLNQGWGGVARRLLRCSCLVREGGVVFMVHCAVLCCVVSCCALHVICCVGLPAEGDRRRLFEALSEQGGIPPFRVRLRG